MTTEILVCENEIDEIVWPGKITLDEMTEIYMGMSRHRTFDAPECVFHVGAHDHYGECALIQFRGEDHAQLIVKHPGPMLGFTTP